MYAEDSQQDPQILFRRVAENIAALSDLFTKEVAYAPDYMAWMLFVDGCAVLQILEKINLSKIKDLKVKVDIQVIVRDLFLLENQLPYKVLKLLSQDESKLKTYLYGLCELQNTFTVLEPPQRLLFRESEHPIEMLKNSSPPTHLLDCLRTYILASDMDSVNKGDCQIDVRQLEEVQLDGREINAANVASNNTNRKEKYISYRNIQELKVSGIQVKRQKNISLKNISFSSSLFGGKLHLPPLILEDSTVTILLNLIAYEMCSDFENKFEICSYVKLLDLLIDSSEDVKELRLAGILHNSLGSDEDVVELFNIISSGLLHNPNLYSEIREVMEKHYKKKLSIWVAEGYYTYFRSPWTFSAFLAASIVLILTALQTWQAFKSNSK